MGGFSDLLGRGVSPEQRSLLQQNNFSLRPLGTVGHLGIWRALLLSWRPVLVFVFAALILVPVGLRRGSEALDRALYVVGLVALLAYPAVALCTLTCGILATRVHSGVRWSAVLYWTWWPAATLLLCCLAAVLGTALGEHVWHAHLLPHAQVQGLQAYQHVDPAVASSVRLQDAGVVLFNSSAAVGRTAAGCHRDGAVYCVAPVLPRGEGGAGGGRSLFVAGVDCCSCPGEFRCGDWSTPAPVGGLRVVDPHDNEFYRLAAEDWSAAHGQKVDRPIFFHWVADPMAVQQASYDKGLRVLCLGLLVGPGLLLALAASLNGLLGLLVDAGWAAPLEAPRKASLRPRPGRSPDLEVGVGSSDPKYVCL